MSGSIILENGDFKVSLPRDKYDRLSYYEKELLWILCDMTHRQGQKSLSGACYCFPGQGKLAEMVGCCRETINKGIKHLKELGLFNTQWRAKVSGHFRSLLYFFGPVIHKGVAIAKSLFSNVFYRVKSNPHILSDKDKISSPEVAKRSKTIKIKGPPSDSVYYEAIRLRREAEYEGGK